MTHSMTPGASGPSLSPTDSIARLLRGESRSPHGVLGAHPVSHDGSDGVVVRVRYPGATTAEVLLDGEAHPMSVENGLFVVFLRDRGLPLRYRVRVHLAGGATREFDDPYRFLPTLGDVDLHLFGEGRHLRLWEKLGAHPVTVDGVAGVSFAVWAPNATRVSVIGSFNEWDGRRHPMRALGGSGVFELFIPGVKAGAIYKYEIRSPRGALRIKTDPYAAMMEQAPGHAAIVVDAPQHEWADSEWMARRADADPLREPMLVYEVHLASWMRGEGNRVLTYREIAPLLAEHVKRLGFTHIELLPVQEHPFGGSWGYQVGGYFAPTSRHGSPDDFRSFVDTLHQAGIGVLLDWVPAHFPKDDWALRRFDGTACYEHEDPRLGEHPEWGTHIFNYARHEVRNFLLANALYWIEEFHIDGLRVDAVASMLYLDYGREAGQWLRNRFGGRENLDAVSFLKQLNYSVGSLHPGVVTIAEESTTWPRVTHRISEGGLGFTFKWNMGWMHDTLDYFSVDPFFRRGAHEKLTFALMYEYSERFVNPLSHDEVVHLKKSLLGKMPGDAWQRFANLRALVGYSVTRPGKSLFFMGTELAPQREWNHDASLDWHLAADPRRQGLELFMQELGALYNANSAFWRRDHDPTGFSWIAVDDKLQSVLAFARFDGTQHAVIVLNLTPVPRENYRIGTPAVGVYRYALNSDEARFGGSSFAVPAEMATEAHPYHGFPQSLALTLPPLSIVVLLPDPVTAEALLESEAAAEIDPMAVPVAPMVPPALEVPRVKPRKPKSGKKGRKHDALNLQGADAFADAFADAPVDDAVAGAIETRAGAPGAGTGSPTAASIYAELAAGPDAPAEAPAPPKSRKERRETTHAGVGTSTSDLLSGERAPVETEEKASSSKGGKRKKDKGGKHKTSGDKGKDKDAGARSRDAESDKGARAGKASKSGKGKGGAGAQPLSGGGANPGTDGHGDPHAAPHIDAPPVPATPIVVDAPLLAKVTKRARSKRPPAVPPSHLLPPPKPPRDAHDDPQGDTARGAKDEGARDPGADGES
jgi:1,4-alpha-glucan branching enzyme